jgi:tetratricopeptide (TPR) repeat protein
MRAYLLSLAALLVVAFSLATGIEPWYQSWEGSRAKSDNLIQVALGDSRQLFARHLFDKADAYFHNGYYPTIYDSKQGFENAHVSQDRHEEGGAEEHEQNFLGKPRDWIDAFSRNFFPARHTHLGESGCGDSCCQRARENQGHDENCEHKDHGSDHEHADEAAGTRTQGIAADEREILPWLQLSLGLDPKRAETYVVAAFWLQKTSGKPDEAERLLRQGLRENPGEPELLFELGKIAFVARNDTGRARNIWELALKNLQERERGKEQPNTFLYAQLLGNMATLEEKDGQNEAAIGYLTRLLAVSPNQESIQKWIDGLGAK